MAAIIMANKTIVPCSTVGTLTVLRLTSATKKKKHASCTSGRFVNINI